MQNLKSKSIAILIALLLTVSVTAMLSQSTVSGHSPPWTIQTYAFLNAGPNPVGLGQQVYINMWVDKPSPNANGAYGDRWQNFKLTITKPDGTNEILGPFTSDDTGGTYTTYTPTTLGNYTFVFNFPGQNLTNANPAPATAANAFVGDWFTPCTSDPVTITVQQDPVSSYPTTPMPTGYWQRPINSMNTNWYLLAGNWLGNGLELRANSMYNASGNFNPYTTAPNSAHIIWTKPMAPGGVMGGDFGGSEMYSNYYSTSQYEPKLTPPIIINGILYYNNYPGSSTSLMGWSAVNLRTGETLWTQNYTTPLIMGQVLNYITPNQYGGLAYLWGRSGTTYSMYDAMTGNWILNIINAPGSGVVFQQDPTGDLVGYYINNTDRSLYCWNATQAISYPTGYIPGVTSINWQWRPAQGSSINWTSGIMWKAPIATVLAQADGTNATISPALAFPSYPVVTGNAILVESSSYLGSSGLGWQPGWMVEGAYSLIDGKQLWLTNRTQSPWTRLSASSGSLNGIYTEFTYETQSIVAYSILTGQKLWGPVIEKGADDSWGSYSTTTIMAYGAVYTSDLDGYVYALNETTGAIMWTWNTGSAGYETPYNIWPLWFINSIADGKVYVLGGHQYSPPLFHGACLYCLNATTGEELWNILDFSDSNNPSTAMADGTLIVPNAYDNQIYAFAQGQSATTIAATPETSTLKTQVLIKGSVTDQSPGQTSLGIPAAGTPAIADQYMTQWMEYLYEQQPKPTNATGVQITLTTLDSNNNIQTIGTTTSDITGHYTFAWTPPISGVYKITATFSGSNSYFSSTAETSIAVSEAAATVAPTQASSASDLASAMNTQLYIIAAGMIAVVIIVLVAAIAIFKKVVK